MLVLVLSGADAERHGDGHDDSSVSNQLVYGCGNGAVGAAVGAVIVVVTIAVVGVSMQVFGALCGIHHSDLVVTMIQD